MLLSWLCWMNNNNNNNSKGGGEWFDAVYMCSYVLCRHPGFVSFIY
jgi:hypothetical protein